MQSFHDTFSRRKQPKRPAGSTRSTGSGRSRGHHQAAVGAAVLLAVLGPVLASAPARAATPSAPARATTGSDKGRTAAASDKGRTAAGSDRLLPGETLQAGQSITAGHDVLTMQGNGNLALIAPGNTPVWTSHTAGNNGASLVMQPGGNLAVVAPGGQALWSAGTAQHPGSMLVLLPNGNAVVSAPASAPTASGPTASTPTASATGSSPSAGSAAKGSASKNNAAKGSAAATNAPLWSTGTSRQTYADIQLATHGWAASQARQFGCLDNIWARESKWNELAGSPASAYGIPQASPGSKMAAAGPDWLTNPQTQIRWGEDYIQGQYGTPCLAWAYWQVHKSY
jgi:hypothetical protein